MSKTVDLSIITPSYNTKELTLACFKSIKKHTEGITYEIICVDNGSTDGSVEAIKKYSKSENNVFVVDAKENLGFGKANNLGAQKAKGEFLLFLNSDTVIFDNALAVVIEKVKVISNLGAYSCRLLNKDHSIQPSGGYFPNLLNLFAWQFFLDDLPYLDKLIPSFHPSVKNYQKKQKLDWVTGAFLLIPSSVFSQVHGFDENIFMYTEEMELCYRINKLGYKTVIENSPAIVHLGGASSGSYLALTSEIKNMLYFWHKHKPKWQLPLAKTMFFVGSLLRLLLFGIIKGDAQKAKVYRDSLGFIF